jgi:hypothetical protein
VQQPAGYTHNWVGNVCLQLEQSNENE